MIFLSIKRHLGFKLRGAEVLYYNLTGISWMMAVFARSHQERCQTLLSPNDNGYRGRGVENGIGRPLGITQKSISERDLYKLSFMFCLFFFGGGWGVREGRRVA